MDRMPEDRHLRRARVLLALGLVIWLIVQARLVQVQLVKSADLAQDVVIDRTEYIAAQRGDIRDRHGLPLAVSVLVPQSECDLARRGPYRRQYPQGQMAGVLTGIVARSEDSGFTGKEGIEFQYEPLLRGVDGLVRYVISGSGLYCRFEPLRIDRLPRPGTSVSLTIDCVYQALAQVEADALRSRHDARWTGILIMRPQTGEILAAAASPSADPENFESGLSTVNPLWSRP
ncbi:MAG: hypothetical protein MUE60_16145, partial [Candidatus Eisenbacteria bacterium]|nr:hypothetical protein [Candidatus Eisenbacteria bacterium]